MRACGLKNVNWVKCLLTRLDTRGKVYEIVGSDSGKSFCSLYFEYSLKPGDRNPSAVWFSDHP